MSSSLSNYINFDVTRKEEYFLHIKDTTKTSSKQTERYKPKKLARKIDNNKRYKRIFNYSKWYLKIFTLFSSTQNKSSFRFMFQSLL